MVHSVLHFYPTIQPPQLRFVLIHSRDRILPELGAQLGDYALKKLQARGIEFMLENRVTGAVPGAVLLGDAASLPTHTLVWTAGNQPNPLLQTLPCERNRAGAVIVDGTLLVDGLTDVWAVGDCAQIPDPYNDGQPYPPTAQHALREGKVAAENIAAVIQGKPVKQFRFRAIGVLVGLGHRTAAAEIRGWRFSGLLAWLMWRTIYLSKLPGAEKKVRVALDWTIDLFFPRDIVVTSSLERTPVLDSNPMSPATQEQPPDNGHDRVNAGDGTE
jgi:NADH dehydrogenase